MIATILLAVAWLSAFVGAALIALTSRAYWNAVNGSSACQPSRRGNAIFGGLLLLVTIVLAVLRDGWGMGLLLGPLLIASGIATTIAVLAVRPGSLHLLRVLASLIRADRQP